MKYLLKLSLLAITILLSSFIISKKGDKPSIFLIGDSTVKNGKGTGKGGQWGWGSFFAEHFDTAKVKIENHARGGTSSRTFQTMGLWDSVMVKLKKGDFVIMQFGHNDTGALDDSLRARGTIKGIGDESKEIYNPITKKQEIVHTYGWYLTKFIKDAQSKGATAIVCSLIPKNSWKNGKVNRSDSYGKWAGEVAKANGVYFIDLNSITADKYDTLGEEKVKGFFPADQNHTNEAGARLNAESVVEGLKSLSPNPLKKYLAKRK